MAISTEEIGGNYTHITGAATTIIGRQSITLKRIVVGNAGSTVTVTLYDGVNTSAPVIAVVALASTQSFDIQTLNGLTVVTSGTCDITVVTRG